MQNMSAVGCVLTHHRAQGDDKPGYMDFGQALMLSSPKIRFPQKQNLHLEQIKIIDFEKWNSKSQQERFFLQRRAQHLFTCRCFFRCKPQANTVPATEAASATVEDVGSGLVGDFVARCWITWFLFVEVCFVNNTFERVDWLPLATPCSNDEICQEDISMTRQSIISAKQR